MVLDGIVLLNKPAGLTSARLVARVKRITRARKVGHTGTLDPAATGLMILGLNRGTRLAQFYLKGAKGYRGTMALGVETDTQDAGGRVIATHPVPVLNIDQIQGIFNSFIGAMEQLPPIHSALKHQGVPLYKLARQGKPVQKPARRIEIHALRLLKLEPPQIDFEVACSAGTYVRTLCTDIGRQLGCGAHLKSLERTQSSSFYLDQAVSLEELEERAKAGRLEELILPLSRALPHLPGIKADKVLTEKIKYGRMIGLTDLQPSEIRDRKGLIKIMDSQDQLLAIVELIPNQTQLPYRGVFIG